MKFTATLVTRPDFQLPVYKGIVVPLQPTEVTDEEIDESLDELREQAADFEDMTEDRGAADGRFRGHRLSRDDRRRAGEREISRRPASRSRAMTIFGST